MTHSPLASVSWPYHTERLSLRPITADDIAATWQYRRLEEVTTWTGSWLTSRDEWEQKVAERGGSLLVAEHDGATIGDFMILVQDGWAQQGSDPVTALQCEAELGWTVDPGHAGRGYATEIGRALLELAFAELGMRRVVANAFADNAPSLRIMERIGMRQEAYSIKDSHHVRRGWIDGVRYAMLREEYEARDRSTHSSVSRVPAREEARLFHLRQLSPGSDVSRETDENRGGET